MMSIRLRLFVILILATATVWGWALIWQQHSTRAEVERVLDRRLSEGAHMVSSLIAEGRIPIGEALDYSRRPMEHGGHDKLSCQIWSLEGRLLAKSDGAPLESLLPPSDDGSGFGIKIIDGDAWRVFTLDDPMRGIRVMVGDSMAMRDGIVSTAVNGLLIPAGLMLPLIALLIWFSVGRGLAPINEVARQLSRRNAVDFGPVPAGKAAPEIRPFLRALDDLFQRVAQTRKTERDFIAFAAHELKTPLAGLKTQAQIAAMTDDADIRAQALDRIADAVDRTDRMVRQLLGLAAAESDETTQSMGPVDLRHVIGQVSQDMTRRAKAAKVDLILTLPQGDLTIIGDPQLLHSALRNLVENAIAVSAPENRVEISVDPVKEGWRVAVLDQGPGIQADDRDRVTQRFYRGAGALHNGSGLGLTIVAVSAERMNAKMVIADGPQGGARISLDFPSASAKDHSSAARPKASQALRSDP